jgi:hypothetical protein
LLSFTDVRLICISLMRSKSMPPPPSSLLLLPWLPLAPMPPPPLPDDDDDALALPFTGQMDCQTFDNHLFC